MSLSGDRTPTPGEFRALCRNQYEEERLTAAYWRYRKLTEDMERCRGLRQMRQLESLAMNPNVPQSLREIAWVELGLTGTEQALEILLRVPKGNRLTPNTTVLMMSVEECERRVVAAREAAEG